MPPDDSEEGVVSPGITPPSTQLLDRQIARALDERGVVPRGGYGGGSGDGGDLSGLVPRVAKVEASIEHIEKDISKLADQVETLRNNARTDFRLLFGAVITVALGLAGLMAKGFHWL